MDTGTRRRSTLADVILRTAAGIIAPGGDRGRLSILIYHRVLKDADDLNTWDVTAAAFEGQMQAVCTNFSTLPLSEAVERLGKRSLPERAICVTFDDGYADNAEVALPILKRCNVPATFFVATGYLNGGRMWNDSVIESICAFAGSEIDLGYCGVGVVPIGTNDQKRAAIVEIQRQWKHLPQSERQARADALGESVGLHRQSTLMMRDDQVKLLRDAGMEIGSHTVSHPILTRIPDVDARREMVESRRYLQELLREPVALFAYPNGKPGVDYEAMHVAMARDAGYRAAVSTGWGVATAKSDPYQLPRFRPWDRGQTKFSLRLALNFCNSSPDIVAAP